MAQKKANETLVKVRNLSVDFRAGQAITHAVKHVSFSIARGETVALVGESGSGKTVSAQSILRSFALPGGLSSERRDFLPRQGIFCVSTSAKCGRSAAVGSRSFFKSR